MKNNIANYRLEFKNDHLLDILSTDYYLELGVVDLKVLTELINGKVLDLNDLIYLELANDGVGKIRDAEDNQNDIYYQMNYLVSTRQKSSTDKFFITCNALRFLNDEGYETYAPIVLIPVEIDYNNFNIVRSGEIIPNTLLINYLYKKFSTKADFKKFNQYISNGKDGQIDLFDKFRHTKFNSVESIDTYCRMLAENFNLKYIIYNYLTTVKVEYHDYVAKDGYFDGELSIFNKEPAEIYREFFEKIKAVLPTNIYQKQVLLRANAGEKFAVNGKLGSGKTYTAINIIADFLARNKRVLYVNQDIDNLFEMEKNLHILNLDNCIYNFSKNIKQLDFQEGIFNETLDNDFDFNIINKLEEYNKDYEIKIHGFNKRLIYEDLATVKRLHKVLEPIEIESNLEYFETTRLYQSLKKVEENLELIDPYETNCWRNIIVVHNNLNVSEIETRTKKMFEANKVLQNELNKFLQIYFLNEPASINDLYTMIFCIGEFVNHKPIKSWLDYQTKIDVQVATSELQTIIDTYYSDLEYYDKNIESTYKQKTIDNIIKRLCIDNYNIYDSNNSDAIYLDKILSEHTNILDLLNYIKTLRSDLLKYEKIFKMYFNTSVIEEYMYNMIAELFDLLNKGYVLKTWYNIFDTNPSELTRMHQVYNVLINELETLKIKLSPYVLKEEYLNFQYTDEAAKSNNFNHYSLRYFNRRQISLTHLSNDYVLKLYRSYYDKQLEINHLICDMTMLKKVSIENQYKSFDNFYNYISKAPNIVIKPIKYFFKNYLYGNSTNRSTIIDNFNNFLIDAKNLYDLENDLRSYKIILRSYLVFDKAHELAKWEDYFTDVLKIKEELKEIFINKEHIDFARVFELSSKDHQISDVKTQMKNKEERFKELLGDSFNGFETDIVSISKLAEYFDNFSSRFIDIKYVDQLFDENVFPNMVKDSEKLLNQYNNWFDAFKSFSSCFRGGQAILQRQSLEKNKTQLQNFLTNVYQLEHVIYITSVVRQCDKYKLYDLSRGIKTGKYKKDIADRFYMSILTKYKDELEKQKSDIYSTTEFLENLNHYSKFEIDYCTNNIRSLSKKVQKEKRSNRITNIQFNDYNYLLDLTDKSRGVYLSDLNIFNSNLDLTNFDLVIIDDAHLSTANKYNRLYECKQVIVLGDKTFRSSIVNTLMQRISDSAIVDFNYRYISMPCKYNNSFGNNNQYILATKVTTYIDKYHNIDEFIQKILEVYGENTDQILNIIVSSGVSKRLIYTKLVDKLVNIYTEQDITTIFNYKIKIINSKFESATYADNVLFYFNDFFDVDENNLDLIFKNFTVVKRRIFICSILDENKPYEEIENKIKYVTRDGNKAKEEEGIVPLILKDLKKKFVRSEVGFGSFDIVVRGNKPLGIVISGRKKENVYSYIDTASFYISTYQRFGWKTLVIDIKELVDNYNEVINKIVDYSKK